MISRNIKKIKIISNKLYSILSTLSLNDFLKDENGGLVLQLNGKALNDEEWIKFKALKIDKNIKSIKKSKLPFDFCEKACVLVDEFRRKTYNLEEEWVIYLIIQQEK